MGNTMYDYWKRQPEVLRRILDGRKTQTAEFVKLFCEVRPDKLYLVGSGTSLNAENAAMAYMEEILDTDVRAVPSSNLPPLRGKRPMVVFISQGGSSTNTLEAMEALKEHPAISITGEAQCEIQRRSRHHMLIGCGEELAGPKTVGYTASVLCMYVCALEAALACGAIGQEKYEAEIGLLYLAAQQMEENIRRTESWFERNREDLVKIHKYVLVGCGSAFAAATEGCLKILETIKVPSMSFEFEEYLHGPIILTDRELGGIFYICDAPGERERMLELARCHAQFSPYAYTVTTDEAIQGGRVLHLLRTGRDHTQVFEAVLPPQLLAARVPELLGLSEGSPMYDLYTKSCPTKYNNGR
ncbi:SIS domain-containing protein [Allofournierella sp.]|uniref:SIS domain-containing protein n=1 Tax=Allofournierella sp. TaxID=1940256 RepID=UPI003AB5C05B